MPAPHYRFWSKVTKTDSCWLWEGETYHTGYGRFWNGQREEAAHRWSYKFFKGEIPKGFEIDHLCAVRICVNPDHLEAVSPTENKLRAKIIKEICINGHLMTPDNTQIIIERRCKECARVKRRKYTRKKLHACAT